MCTTSEPPSRSATPSPPPSPTYGAQRAPSRHLKLRLHFGEEPGWCIVSGLCAQPTYGAGYRWNARYTIASGNLMADLRFDVTAESQGRLRWRS